MGAETPCQFRVVMPGLGPGIHVLLCARGKTWMAGTSPAMTSWMDNVKPIVTALLLAFAVPQASAETLPGGFVYLREIDPTIIQDIRYATANNFVGRPLAGYGAGECVVKREVGLRLKAVQQDLSAQNLSLKMFDCYRPARASLDMVRWSQNGHETSADRRYNPKIPKTELFPPRLYCEPLAAFDRRGARPHISRSQGRQFRQNRSVKILRRLP